MSGNLDRHDDDCGCTICRADAFIEAGMTRRMSGDVPAGWVMVPREPTEEMVVAGRDAALDEDCGDNDVVTIAAWVAMLAASPKPTIVEASGMVVTSPDAATRVRSPRA